MALPLFAITLFVSAFLLFLVQPMIGKMILPKLGGTPMVWNTCMVFFQTVLLAGYFYTHAATTYLKPRKQMTLHACLLLLPLIVLLGLSKGKPFDVSSWVPPLGSNPIGATLLLLTVVVGIPFFVVSTSAPLLQRWFSYSGDKAGKDPYFLYGASNLGSMLSLLAYPFFVEPMAKLETQTWIWTYGFIFLALMILACAALVWKRVGDTDGESTPAPIEESKPVPEIAPAAASTAIQPSRQLGKKKGLKGGQSVSTGPTLQTPSVARKAGYDPQSAPVTWFRRIRWILLAALPSSLMLGVTSYVSTDLSPFPLLWVIPLALYLISFTLVFAKWPIEWTKEPHKLFLFAAAPAICGLCWVLFSRDHSPLGPTMISFFCFFLITMALHGELAKDRPAPRHLTEFFLLMSVGGMLGGVFNALLAPVLFNGVIEYPLAIMAACFLRPNMVDYGWSDGFLLGSSGVRDSAREASNSFAKSFGKEPKNEPFLLAYGMDIVVGLLITALGWLTISNAGTMVRGLASFLTFCGADNRFLAEWRSQIQQIAIYGLPIAAAILVSARKLRFAVAICGLLIIGYFLADRGRKPLYADRSYFGVLKVFSEEEEIRDRRGTPIFDEAERLPKEQTEAAYTYLMHGTTYHGRNYQPADLSRLSTTYYHRFGPVGIIMERYNWFPGKQNTYYGDARLPVSLIGQGAESLGIGGLHLGQLASVWSEPPFATIGLGSGTMASYCRPFQHLTYYEIDDKIRAMSLPPAGKEPYFKYVKEAGDRGGNVEIIMGDARLSLEKEADREKVRVAENQGGATAMRNGYYKVIVVDAFSSDAIPVHLITEEAIQLYMDKLSPDGVLCVHTSNRHLKLTQPVADIAKKLNLDAFIGHDSGARDAGDERLENRIYSLGHFGSQYIMLARKGVKDGPQKMEAPLIQTKLENAIRGYPEKMLTSKGQEAKVITSVTEWKRARVANREIWTDQYQDIVSIIRRASDRRDEE